MATAVRAAASRAAADRGLLEFPTMTPAITPVESPPVGQAEDGPPCRHFYHIAKSDRSITKQHSRHLRRTGESCPLKRMSDIGVEGTPLAGAASGVSSDKIQV